MGFFDHQSDEAKAHDEVVNSGHKSELSHELLAAAASYEAAKAYNDHCDKSGTPATHAKAKELLAAFSGAFIDHIIETKGLDFIDAQKAKHAAKTKLDEASANEFPSS